MKTYVRLFPLPQLPFFHIYIISALLVIFPTVDSFFLIWLGKIGLKSMKVFFWRFSTTSREYATNWRRGYLRIICVVMDSLGVVENLQRNTFIYFRTPNTKLWLWLKTIQKLTWAVRSVWKKPKLEVRVMHCIYVNIDSWLCHYFCVIQFQSYIRKAISLQRLQ